ncbi:MAG: hypothetical protein ACMUJM_12400 [bacterium]
METKIIKVIAVQFLVLLIGALILYLPHAHAQNWVELPPYNTLWPLWSPALSPIDAGTGLPTPIVTSLASDTLLPIAPGLTWDPSLPYPWLLYNTFSGLAYFDPLAGINLWPAPSLLDDAGNPAAIALPPDYANLPPTDGIWLVNNVPTANLYYRLYFTSIPVIPPTTPITGPTNSVLATLLTPLDILGPTLGVPTILAPPLPLPIPTAPVPTLITPTAAISQLILAEQTGTWQGIWSTGTLSGQMTLNLTEDPVFGTLAGYVQLLGNTNLWTLVEVTGEVLNTQIIVSGSGIGFGGMTFTIDVAGILDTPDTMSGTYSIANTSGSLTENGSFKLALVAPVVF